MIYQHNNKQGKGCQFITSWLQEHAQSVSVVFAFDCHFCYMPHDEKRKAHAME
jgi:hypothetical protein